MHAILLIKEKEKTFVSGMNNYHSVALTAILMRSLEMAGHGPRKRQHLHQCGLSSVHLQEEPIYI